MKHYEKLYAAVMNLQYGRAIGNGASAGKVDLHHAFLHNTKQNRKEFPYLIDSPFNIFGLSHLFHLSNPSWMPFFIPHEFLTLLEKALFDADIEIYTTEKTFDEIYGKLKSTMTKKFREFCVDCTQGKTIIFEDRLLADFVWVWEARK